MGSTEPKTAFLIVFFTFYHFNETYIAIASDKDINIKQRLGFAPYTSNQNFAAPTSDKFRL